MSAMFRPNHTHSRHPQRGGGWLGAGLAAAALGLVAILAPLPPPRAASTAAADTHVALQILTDSISLVSSQTLAQVITTTPTPTPTLSPTTHATPTPTPAPHSSASPCPTHVSITNTGPGSSVHYSCRSSVTTRTGSSSNISVQSSSTQSSTGGTNSSTSNTSITITGN